MTFTKDPFPDTGNTATYYIGDSQASWSFTDSDLQGDGLSSLISCGNFNVEMVNGNGSPYDASVFDFDPATKTVSVETSDPTKVAIYTLKLILKLEDYNLAAGEFQFEIRIESLLPTTVVASSPPSNLNYELG